MRILGDDLTSHSDLTQGKGLCRRYVFQESTLKTKGQSGLPIALFKESRWFISCTQTSFRPLIIERKQTNNESQQQRERGFLIFRFWLIKAVYSVDIIASGENFQWIKTCDLSNRSVGEQDLPRSSHFVRHCHFLSCDFLLSSMLVVSDSCRYGVITPFHLSIH